jgi:predicted HTH transcriptional regulator
MDATTLETLIHEFQKLPSETEWLEFKHNNTNPNEIGETISALSNSAALLKRPNAYIVWGIDDASHAIVGTTFKPHETKVGNEELENWLLKIMDPRVHIQIYEAKIDGQPVVVFEVPPAPNKPVRFNGTESVRVGSYTKKLRDFPEKERALWKTFDSVPFEDGLAADQVSADDVLAWLDYPKYFELMGQSLPDNRAAILQKLESERIIAQQAGDRYGITNLGAILFARDLKKFARLARKALRVIIYKGTSRVETIKEPEISQGYAVGFESAIAYINDQLPHNEQIGKALRKEVRMYPEIAIRELVANALIHQDFSVTGAGPMVEIFTDRMEVTNPGEPLIETLRFIDEPPRSRNEILASLMRRMTICEERGSGIDKVISQVEVFQLPAPDFRVAGHNTVATLLGPRTFRQLNRAERIRACYQHACLLYVTGQRMSNASFRKRLGIADKNYPQASSIIQDTIREKLIKPHGKGSASKRDSTYVPFWA